MSSPGAITQFQTQTTKDVGGWVNFKLFHSPHCSRALVIGSANLELEQ